MMWSILLLLVVSLTTSSSQEIRADPAPIIYPGQVNIGLISNVHGPTTNGSDGCGTLRPEAVQRAMAAVWAAHQANYEKDDPQELNIGIYIFDTCGREDVAERQVYRLLGHVGHVQTTDCSEKRIPPLFAVITEGDTQYLGVPLKLLQAFSVPVISTSGPLLPKTLSTAPSAEGLARAAVSVLRHLHLLEVAVMAEDNPPMGLFEAFSRQVQVSGMQAIQLDNGTDQSGDDFMATLKLISEYGKSRLKAVVFLIGSEQALQLLRSVDDMNLPQIPWVIVTPSDISNEILTTFQKQQIQRLQKILLLSPESLEVPEFDDYFRQLLEEDTIKYHPLLMEFLQTVEGSAANGSVTPADSLPITTLSIFGNNTVSARLRPDVYPADVSSMVKAVWTLSAALKTVQRRSCRRGTDCLLYLRRSLSSYVARAASGIDHIVESGAENLKGTRLKFNEEGIMTSNKYGLKGFTVRGDIKEVGFFSDDEGLNVDRYILDTFTEAITFTEPIAPLTLTPKPEFKFKLKPDKVLPSPELTPSKSTAEEPSTKFPLKSQDLVKWKILEDIVVTEVPTETITDRETTTPKENIHNDIDVVVALHDEVDLQSLSSNASSLRHSSAAASMIGPSYTSEHRAPPASSSSNLRSISLTSHQEPRVNDAYRDDVRSRPATNSNHPSTPTEDVKVTRPNRHVSAWLGRPWALSVLGVCGFLILATLYILVFLMVKACEGTLKKTNCCLAGTQLVALLCLYIAAALYTWKPSSLLCGLQRLIPNISLAFCYGCLLLKGMYLRAQNSLGLGGSVNRFNQMLTLLFIVGVQVALETQWWLVKPPRISEESLECLIGKTEILQSQVYVAFLLLLSTALAVSTRRIPYNQQESRSLIATTLSCLVIFLSWEIACWLLPDATSRNIAAPSALMATALTILLGIFGPQLFAIHKYGGFPHKPLSYADSLSTVFTMFKDLDNTSSSGTTSRGKKNAKTLETPFANEIGEGTRNPLYSDYQSAYP